MSSNKAFTVLYLEVLLVVVVDGGQHNAHEDVEVDDNEDCKENDKPVVIVICWHPKQQGKTRSHAPQQTSMGVILDLLAMYPEM